MSTTRRWLILFPVGLLIGTAAFTHEGEQLDPTGAWKWKLTIGDQTRKMTLRLRMENLKVTALIVCEGQQILVQDADYKDAKISFTVITEQDGQKTISKYSGKVSADVINGKIVTERQGQKTSQDWMAKRIVAEKASVAFIERHYAKQLKRLAEYAHSYEHAYHMDPPPHSDETQRLFSNASIVDATVDGSNSINKGGFAVKRPPPRTRLEGTSCWFRRTPSVGKPVVNLWQGDGKQFAEYVRAIRDVGGKERSYTLILDLSSIDDLDD